MKIKMIKDEDFSNYKKASMIIGFPTCTFKCEKECGEKVCQNGTLATSKTIDIPIPVIVKRYMENVITDAIVFGGLEPFDSFGDLYNLIVAFRKVTNDDIVIYTGYKKNEVTKYIEKIKKFRNIIVKFGRFIPGETWRIDDTLGIKLASSNQYAERIS